MSMRCTHEDMCRSGFERKRRETDYVSRVSDSVLNRYFSIFCNTSGLDTNGFGAAVMAETDRAVLHVPAGIDLSTRLTHQTQRANVCAGLTELSRNVKRIRVSDKCRCDVSAYLTDFCRTFKIYCLPANLVSVLADCCLCHS